METSTLNQLIESVGIALIALIMRSAYLEDLETLKWKKNIKRESDLLKDIIFFRTLEKKYLDTKEDTGKTGFIKMRQSVQDDLSYNISIHSEPARIKKRLKELAQQKEELNNFISKITIVNN